MALGVLSSCGGTIVNSSREITKPQVISATVLRTKTRDILEEARFAGEHFVVETFGKPMVAIVGIEQYRQLMNQTRGQDATAIEE
jgi:hypothetical protein